MTELPIKNIIEAAIFTADEPVSLIKIGHLFSEHKRPDNEELKKVLEELAADYSDRVVELIKVASGYRFQARIDYAPWLQRLVERKPPRYSRALLETLALIAYKQPITRGEIEGVRGVAVSSNIVKTLIERNWVKQVGYREVPGRPALLATTKQFLDYFNLTKLTDLPELSELMNLDELGQKLGMQLTLEESAENSENCANEAADVEQEASDQEQGAAVASMVLDGSSNEEVEQKDPSQGEIEVADAVALNEIDVEGIDAAVTNETEEHILDDAQQSSGASLNMHGEAERVTAEDELYPQDQLPAVEQGENNSISSEQPVREEQENEVDVVEEPAQV